MRRNRPMKSQIDEARDAGIFADFPPVLTFLSWVDATVDTSATIHRLYEKLQNKGSEIIVFDVNRFDQLAPFIPAANDKPLKHLEARSDLPYRLTIITNMARNSNRMVQRTKAPRSSAIDSSRLKRPFSLTRSTVQTKTTTPITKDCRWADFNHAARPIF